MQENLRQLCVFDLAKKAGRQFLWWVAWWVVVGGWGACGSRWVKACGWLPAPPRSLCPPARLPAPRPRWDYVTLFGQHCDMESHKYGQECAEKVFEQVGISSAGVL